MKRNKPTLHDVAEVASVSIATVSNVLNNKSTELSDKTRDKVLSAIKELNYEPNQFARGLKTGRSNIIAFIIPDQNPFFTEVLTELSFECQKHQLHVVVASSEENEEKQRDLIDTFISQNVSAVILVPVKSDFNIEEEWLKIPIMTLDRALKTTNIPSITVDNVDAAYHATKRILENNCQSVGLLLANPKISTTIGRKSGYEKALADVDIMINPNLIFYSDLQFGTDAQIKSGYNATKKLLSRGIKGIVSTNHLLLLGALQAIRESGKVIGKDVIIVGFDDSYWNEIYTPKLSVISQPVKEMGQKAGEMIFKLIQGKEVESIKLSTNLIIRESCSFIEK
ncbi:LacI family DNA-binding transcriptional regulator [Staphylococcus caeli]|uniref:LacI family DNA-binding transcriptional regulator n=1 Tax=Staphylococcus caeli TaxID=2201815 RepID=UPI003F544F0A